MITSHRRRRELKRVNAFAKSLDCPEIPVTVHRFPFVKICLDNFYREQLDYSQAVASDDLRGLSPRQISEDYDLNGWSS